MIFDKKLKPSCAYCLFGSSLGYDEYFCVRRGIMSSAGSCGKYRYEPTKRVPIPLPNFREKAYTAEDFTL